MLVSFRSPITTRAPSRRNVRAVARPMPLAPPVMMATVPSSRPFMSREPSPAQMKRLGQMKIRAKGARRKRPVCDHRADNLFLAGRRRCTMSNNVSDALADPLVTLRFEDRGASGRIARITFDNPAKRNALGLAGKAEFIDVMSSLRHDESLRVVVITGAGDKSFVAGTDLSEMARFDMAAAEASATKTHRTCDALRTFPIPVIARINGDCFGSGMELAACADLRVSADHARFG